MTANFPTTYDAVSDVFGALSSLAVLTLNGGHNFAATTFTFNESVVGIGIDTTLVAAGSGFSEVVFTGAGLDDETFGGTYDGIPNRVDFVVQIDGTGSPDTFKWSKDAGATWEDTAVPCSTGATALSDGVTILFAASTGHTIGNNWALSAGIELIRVTVNNTTNLTVTRGFDNSVIRAYTTGHTFTQDITSGDFTRLRDVVLAAQKFAGLVGLFAARPMGCLPGEVYIATNTSTVYVCFETDTWTAFQIADHGGFSGLADDDHTQYQNDARALSWHSGIGSHISAVAHDHSGTTEGAPVTRFHSGLDSAKGTPTAVGQLYMAYDTGNLYFANAAGTSWVQYQGVQKGSIMFFESACPSGWTAVGSLDGKYPKAADTSEWTGLTSGGEATHLHSVPEVPAHSHIIERGGFATNTIGAHTHTYAVRSGAGGTTLPYFVADYGTDNLSTSSAGAHTHSATIAAHNTNSVDPIAATNASSIGLQTYTLRACRKD